jgi:uncharacterized RDD family membrane protein YckC
MEFKSADILENIQPVTYGTFWQRVAASIIDGLIVTIPLAIIERFIFPQEVIVRPDYGYSSYFFLRGFISSAGLLNVLVNWLYSALQESSSTQATIGKKAMGLMVTDLEGNRISFGRATGRFFAKYLSTVILFIGYLMMLWSEKRQTLHDKLAETLVIRSDR